MIRKVVAVIISLFLALSPMIALADTTAVVTVYGVPSFSGGINGFTITYVSDTRLDLNWGLGVDAAHIMIRAKYGSYPADIPNENTTPSDGYLVYYGSGTSVSDTSMNFDENAGLLYYKAWAQKPDGTWYVNTSTGKKESETMALIALLALGLGVSWFAIAKREIVIGLIASVIWLAVLIYTRSNPIGNSVTGDSFDNIIVAVFLGLIAIVPFLCWSLKKQYKMREDKDDNYKQAALPHRIENKSPNRESSDEYFERLHRVTHPKK